MVELSVDEARDRPDPGGMATTMLAILLGQRLVAAEAADGVLDADPCVGEGGVVDDILGWARLSPRLAPWREAQAGGMERGHPDVGQVAEHPHVRLQPIEQA